MAPTTWINGRRPDLCDKPSCRNYGKALPEVVDFSLGASGSEVVTVKSSDGHRFLLNKQAISFFSAVIRSLFDTGDTSIRDIPVLEHSGHALNIVFRTCLLPEASFTEFCNSGHTRAEALTAAEALVMPLTSHAIKTHIMEYYLDSPSEAADILSDSEDQEASETASILVNLLRVTRSNMFDSHETARISADRASAARLITKHAEAMGEILDLMLQHAPKPCAKFEAHSNFLQDARTTWLEFLKGLHLETNRWMESPESFSGAPILWDHGIDELLGVFTTECDSCRVYLPQTCSLLKELIKEKGIFRKLHDLTVTSRF